MYCFKLFFRCVLLIATCYFISACGVPAHVDQVYEHAVPLLPAGSPDETVPKQPMPLLRSAINKHFNESLKTAGLVHANLIFIPATYSSSYKNSLYIDGKHYVSPNGFSNVLGAIKSNQGYLVAVLETRSNTYHSADKLLAYYNVSKLGKTIHQVGILPTNMDRAIVTTHAIYAINGYAGSISFDGLTVTGEPVSGPQHVIDATALSNNGWLVLKPYQSAFPVMSGWSHIGNGQPKRIIAAQSSVYYQSPKGTTALLGTSPIKYFLHTQKIYVNKSTLTDSVDANSVWTLSEYTSCKTCGNVFRTYPFGLLVTGSHAQIVSGDGMYVPVTPSVTITQNFTLGRSNQQPINVWQGRHYGNFIFANNPVITKSEPYRVLGWTKDQALNGHRGWLWNGQTRLVQTIETPDRIIVYRNQGDSKISKGYDRQGLGIDLLTHHYIRKEKLLGWLTTYGVALGKYQQY